MSEQLQNLKYLTDARPDSNARFYIYLSSASWCPPCRAIMPRVVAQYADIKADGGEIILVCCDRTAEAGRSYLKKYGAKFPAVMVEESRHLPGFTQPRGIPNAIFVSADGKVMHKGHGSHTLSWKSIIAQ